MNIYMLLSVSVPVPNVCFEHGKNDGECPFYSQNFALFLIIDILRMDVRYYSVFE